MKQSIPLTLFVMFLAATLAFSTLVLPAAAEEHEDHEEHEAGMSDVAHDVADAASSGRVELMQQLLALLTQVAGILQQRVDMQAGAEHDHDEHDHGKELTISVEEHNDRTHIHVIEPGEETVTFFLDDLELSQKAEIIAAIAARTGHTEAEVEAAATFPESEEEHEHEQEEDKEMDLSGIHIMSDGMVMLGNGEALEHATVNEDGMIVLEDGTEVEPEFDLR